MREVAVGRGREFHRTPWDGSRISIPEVEDGGDWEHLMLISHREDMALALRYLGFFSIRSPVSQGELETGTVDSEHFRAYIRAKQGDFLESMPHYKQRERMTASMTLVVGGLRQTFPEQIVRGTDMYDLSITPKQYRPDKTDIRPPLRNIGIVRVSGQSKNEE